MEYNLFPNVIARKRIENKSKRAVGNDVKSLCIDKNNCAKIGMKLYIIVYRITNENYALHKYSPYILSFCRHVPE